MEGGRGDEGGGEGEGEVLGVSEAVRGRKWEEGG